MQDFGLALEAHHAFRTAALSNPDVHEVRTREEVSKPESTGLLFGMQHVPKEMTFERLRQLREAGLRVMALAYRGVNEYAGGFMSNAGLTSRGKELITWMSECGILLDVSHANHRTIRMAINFIRSEHLPVKPMASHSGCLSVFLHSRNLPDDLMKDIARKEGYIGIPLITFYLGRQGCSYMGNFVKHVKHAITMTGLNTIGVGSDCPHINMTVLEARKHFGTMTQILKTGGLFGEYFPDRPLELITTGSRMFEILERKFRSEELGGLVSEGLLGGNFRAYLERSLPRV